MQSTEKLCNGKRQTTRAHIPTYTCVLQTGRGRGIPIPDIQSATSAAFRLCLAFCFTAECKLFMPHGGITHLRPFCTWQCNQSERREANNKSHNATLPHCHFPLATFHFHSSAIRLRRSSPSDRKLKSFVFISVI